MKTNKSTFNMLTLVCYCVLILLVTYSAVGEWQWHLLIAFSFQLLICLGIVDTCRDQFETQHQASSVINGVCACNAPVRGKLGCRICGRPIVGANYSTLDSARLEWLMAHVSGAEYRRLGIIYSAGMTREDLDNAMKRN